VKTKTIATFLTVALAAVMAASPLAAVPPADPTTSTSYPCHYVQKWNWNQGDGAGLVVGEIRFPSSTCSMADGPPAGRPVLIFAHGNGMDHEDHEYLMAHVTKNGFVTASIANSGDSETRALQMISYLNSLHEFWGWSSRLSDDVAFAGHSRGGEAAVTAARLLGDTPALGDKPYDVRAVISIAPTDGGGVGGPGEDLTGEATNGYLAIYGSRDMDVSGSESSISTPDPDNTAFAIYDRAGSESSSEGLVIAGTHLDKAFVFLHGLGHGVFLDYVGLPLFGAIEGQNSAKAYFNAFLRWKVLGQTSYRVFFDGTERPPSLAGVELFQQLSSGTRRVVDNFENGNLATSTIGGTVATSPAGIITFLEDPLFELVRSSPHETGGVRATWSGASWLRWSIPNSSPAFIGPLRDVTDYTHLSLRVSQVYANAFNTVGQDQDFRVHLVTGMGASTRVRVSLHGRVPYPDEFQCTGGTGCGLTPPNDYSKSALSTIRIPLSAFGNADLTDVQYIFLDFDLPERPDGAITIDSLEFVQ